MSFGKLTAGVAGGILLALLILNVVSAFQAELRHDRQFNSWLSETRAAIKKIDNREEREQLQKLVSIAVKAHLAGRDRDEVVKLQKVISKGTSPVQSQ